MPHRHGNEPELHAQVRKILDEYPTLATNIERYEMEARGEGIFIQPSITSHISLEEDDAEVLDKIRRTALTDEQQGMVDTLRRYLNPDKIRFATRGRIVHLMEDIIPGTSQEEKEILSHFKDKLESKVDKDESVALTPVERVAYARLVVIEHAQRSLAYLKPRKERIDFALDAMRRHYPEEYIILVEKYIHKKTVAEICDLFIPLHNIPLTQGRYDGMRPKAVEHFAEFLGLTVVDVQN